MIKKFVAVLAILGTLIGISACSNAEAEAPKTVVLNGTWTSSDPEMTATVVNNTIEIDWKAQDVSALYWKGTFVESATNGQVIQSNGDVDAMASSMLASTATTKNFTFADDSLSFEFTVAGVKQTVHLKR